MIDFLKYRPLSYVLSVAIFAAFFGSYYYRETTQPYAFNYSVEFTGGTSVLMRISKLLMASEIKSILEESSEFKSPEVRVFYQKGNQSTQDILIKVQNYSNDSKGLAERMKDVLSAKVSGMNVEVLQTDSIGAGIGKELRWKSFLAILLASLAMVAYVFARFWSLGYAFGTIVSLVHDAIVILTVFLIFNLEMSINVIGAILAMLGYSMNDTIVIFSRIRENLSKRIPSESIYDIVNKSLNQTLRRTILTSFATSLAVVSLFVLGGEALRTLSLVFLVGIVFGTYSSIYIATPVILWFYKDNK